MMDTMMAGAYKYGFKPAGHFMYVLSVHQYTIGLGYAVHEHYVQRMKTHQANRDEIYKTVNRL